MRLQRDTHQFVYSILVLLLGMLFAVNGGPCYGQAVAVDPSYYPLTRAEQANQLDKLLGLTSIQNGIKTGWANLFRTIPSEPQDYSGQWNSASMNMNKRIDLSKNIGEEGASRYAAERGWIQLLGSQNRGISQGPDFLYYDPKTNKYKAIEAKGGSSQVKKTYGSWQGTNENVIKSAEWVLKSNSTSYEEKLAAAMVIKAAQKNNLNTGVVNTPHVLGKPKYPELKGSWDTKDVSGMALHSEIDLVDKKPHLKNIFKDAEVKIRVAGIKFLTTRVMAGLGVVGSVFSGIDASNQSVEAWNMFQDSTLNGSMLPYMQSAYAVSEWGMAGTLFLDSAWELGKFGNIRWLGRAGELAGKWFVPVAVVTEVVGLGVSYNKYVNGRISPLEWSRAKTDTGIVLGSMAAGATVGAAIGVWFGGAGALPAAAAGAVHGAGYGMIAGFIGKFGVNIHRGNQDKLYNEEQQQAFNEALDGRYGLH